VVKKLTPEDFWRKIDRKSEAECWPWLGPTHAGYGRLEYRGKKYFAHRLAYILTRGVLPENLVIDHLCSNKRCCNPAHFDWVSDRLNIARGTTSKKWGKRRFRNVRLGEESCRWRVVLRSGKVAVNGGTFDHEEVAAMQADVLAARLFPGFRAFNAPEMG